MFLYLNLNTYIYIYYICLSYTHILTWSYSYLNFTELKPFFRGKHFQHRKSYGSLYPRGSHTGIETQQRTHRKTDMKGRVYWEYNMYIMCTRYTFIHYLTVGRPLHTWTSQNLQHLSGQTTIIPKPELRALCGDLGWGRYNLPRSIQKNQKQTQSWLEKPIPSTVSPSQEMPRWRGQKSRFLGTGHPTSKWGILILGI